MTADKDHQPSDRPATCHGGEGKGAGPRQLTIGSLFSGIGGLELGLERTNHFKTIWQSEIDPWASAVLKKHWPGVENLGDITKIDWEKVQRPDLICGGFPCVDISPGGKKEGIKAGKGSALWHYYGEAIRILRPKYALIENSSELPFRGLDIVLRDLAACGYDAEWNTLSAGAIGAAQNRARTFIVAYPQNDRNGWREQRPQGGQSPQDVANTCRVRLFKTTKRKLMERSKETGKWWESEPRVGRVAPRVSERIHRIRCLGNSVVPQIVSIIGGWIAADAEREAI